MKKILAITATIVSSFVVFLAVRKSFGSAEEYGAVSSDNKKTAPTGRTSNRKRTTKISKRERKILDLFGKKDELMMKEIKQHFPNVTKRTLRRDMDKLQKKGLVEKHGATKSSSYTLVV